MELQVANGNLIYTDLKQVSILLNSITSKVYDEKNSRVIVFTNDNKWVVFEFSQITSPVFNLFSDMIEWFDDYATVESGTSGMSAQNVAS